MAKDIGPIPPPEIEEWGGELILVIGHTSGGAPFGFTETECEDDPELKAVFESWKQLDPEMRYPTPKHTKKRSANK